MLLKWFSQRVTGMGLGLAALGLMLSSCGGQGGSDYYTPTTSTQPPSVDNPDGSTGDGSTDPGSAAQGLTAEQLFERGDLVSGEMLTRVNGQRTAHDLPPLTWDDRLEEAALVQLFDVISGHDGALSHIGTDGSTVFDRVIREGYPAAVAGENLAKGQLSVFEAIEAWMNSPPHRANILNTEYTQIGAAVVYDDVPYWAQVFGRPGSGDINTVPREDIDDAAPTKSDTNELLQTDG